MPLVRVRIMLGQAQLACPMRPFAASATLMTLLQLGKLTAGLGALKNDARVSRELAVWLRKLVTKPAAYKGWREAGTAKLKQLADDYAAHKKRKAAEAAELAEDDLDEASVRVPTKTQKLDLALDDDGDGDAKLSKSEEESSSDEPPDTSDMDSD